MNRRAFLTAVPAFAVSASVAGCAARLGLVDRVTVAEKYVRVAEREDADEDEYVELARRRFDPASGPAYEGEIHEALAEDLDPDDPLTISGDVSSRLEGSFAAVRYGMRGCGSIDEGEREPEDANETGNDADDGTETAGENCRDTWLFLDDFNDLEVGNVVDVRYGDEVSGIVSVRE